MFPKEFPTPTAQSEKATASQQCGPRDALDHVKEDENELFPQLQKAELDLVALADALIEGNTAFIEDSWHGRHPTEEIPK